MQKNLFDLKLFRFSKYLNDIGILSKLNTEKFQKYFYELTSDKNNSKDISLNNINLNFIYFKKYIISALINYIQSLSEEEQKILALSIYNKYNSRENQINEKLIRIIDLYSKQQVRTCFNKWKAEIIILTNSLKKVISSNILSNIQNSLNSKLIQNIKKLNIPNENINIINNNRIINSNNSMLNINHNLNISTNPDLYNNNIDNINYNFHNTSINENDNNNSNKNKRKTFTETKGAYSINNFNPSNNFLYNYKYINDNYHNDSYKYIQNYLNKANSNLHPISKQINSGNNSVYIDKTKTNTNNSHTNLSSKKTKKTKSKVNIDYIINLSKSKTEHNIIPERTSAYIKEQEELTNFCTFKPKINKSSSFSRYWNSSNKRPIDRLYLDSKNRIARKEMEFLKKTNLESKQNTFQPRFISSSVKRVKSDFDKRLKEFEINKKNKIQKLSQNIEEEQKQQFTFTPKINEITYNNSNKYNKRNINSLNNNNNNNYTISNISKNSTINQSMISKNNTNSKKIPAYKRLYNENKNKLIRQEKREKEELEKIKKNSSKISEGNNNILDKKKIEELYNDYKMKKTRLKIKQEEIEKEQGITFHPELISDKNYFNKINPDFYMREKIFLEKQQKNLEIYKQYLEKETSKKNYSYEEKKDIYNNIVTRLYKNGMEKYRERNGNNNFKNTFDDNISEKEIKNDMFFKNNFNGNESDICSQKIY